MQGAKDFPILKIINSDIDDIPETFRLFFDAIAYQQKHGYNLWPQFSEELILKEISEKRHWKIMDEDKIACVFSVMYSDPVIWKERDSEPAVYLHRIAVNPEYKGKKLMLLIRDWASEHARRLNKKFLRMDTWGRNVNLREYYISCGFNYIGQQFLDEEEQHYGGNELSLFEIEI